ncbi:MAG: DNA-processing protein DprA [Candidatus Pacebacteria bacterium]|nr:DNA-processing protein DprA [Candidatus Paceibacterota bacterium]
MPFETNNSQYIELSKKITNIPLPYLLGQISDPPKKLFALGNTSLFDDSSIKFLCIVGSRRYSSYGYDAVRQIIQSLKGHPVAIVSGLALGIDSIAHTTALEIGLPCIAVPGSGLNKDVLYPRTHLGLAESILKNGGTLLSEFEPEFRASPWSFPMRNRIMAGLSHVVLVIEGEEDSGTLITARLALDYNRDVCALPGSIFSETSKGPLTLIKGGAVPICTPEDLHKLLGLKTDLVLEDAPEKAEEYIREKIDRCSDEEKNIMSKLNEPKSREELLAETGIELSKLQISISMLEIRGLVTEEYGYVRKVRSIHI